MKKNLLWLVALLIVATGLLYAGPSIFQVYQGGTGASSFTAHGVLLGEGSSAFVATGTGTAGQVLTSNGPSSDPTYQTLGSGAASANCGTGTPATVQGLYVWLDASQLTGYSDGNQVFSWTNEACGPVVSSTYTTSAAVFKTNIINGLPVVRFANDGYFAFICPECVQSREVSIFLVLKMSSLANTYTGIVTGFSGGFGWYVKSNGKTAFYTQGTNYDGTGTYTFGTSSFQVMDLIVAVPGMTTREALSGDATSSNQSFNLTSTGPSVLLGSDSTSGRILTGDIAEVLIYRRPLNSADRNTLENYLKTKYGL